ncbi:MAG: hypothetical protein IKN34_08045 [Treponema sp.]|nr:hypothetical protein [Treponema sp.]
MCRKFSSFKFQSSFFIFQFTLLFLLFSCADWFQDKVGMNTDSNNVTLEDFFYKAAAVDSLDSPMQVFASKGMYSGKIAINWTKVDNATSYRIERAVVKADSAGKYALPEESDFDLLVEYCYSTTYTDTILSNPTSTSAEYFNHYFYRITSVNYSMNLESDPSNPNDSSTRAEGYLLSPPTNIEVDKGKSSTEIGITWTGVSEAVYYKIYRGEKENGTGMELIDTVRGNVYSYTDGILSSEQGTEFYYKIAAQNSNGNDSAYSSIAMGYSLKEGAPSAPEKVIVDDGKGKSTTQLKVTWDSVAATSATSTITYSLYRASSEDSVYTLLKNKLTATTYTDSANLKSGIFYYYYVQTVAYDSATQENLKSAFSEKTDDSFGFLLSPPSEFEIRDSSSSEKVVAAWTPSIGSDSITFTYSVYASESENGTYSKVAENITGSETDGYLSKEVDKFNFYKITATNEDGTESDFSSLAAPMPSAPKNVVASKTKYLDKDFSPNKNNVYPVLISWEKPDSDNPAGYYVYRSSKPDSSFRKITDTLVTDFEYIDSNDTAKAGTPYYYKVVSVNSLGQGKKGNDPSTDSKGSDGFVTSLGYGALTREQWFREYNKTVKASQKKLTLMHKPNDMDKLGSETISGDISGTLSYKAAVAGLGAEITMPYSNYADFYINSDSSLGVYFLLNGNTDTTSNMSGNGNMHGSVVCTGMYPGTASYGNLQIKGGAAGGGSYGVVTKDLQGNIVFESGEISWLIGEE